MLDVFTVCSYCSHMVSLFLSMLGCVGAHSMFASQDSYYRRNYKEYFEFVEGTVQRGAELGLSDSTKEGIRRWLEANR